MIDTNEYPNANEPKSKATSNIFIVQSPCVFEYNIGHIQISKVNKSIALIQLLMYNLNQKE